MSRNTSRIDISCTDEEIANILHRSTGPAAGQRAGQRAGEAASQMGGGAANDQTIAGQANNRPVPTAGLAGTHTCRYNQNEDQFLLLAEPITVPSLPVHHDIDNPNPPQGYTAVIQTLAERIATLVPELLSGMNWFFDPLSIHIPPFYRIVPCAGRVYLKIVLIDLTCRPLESEILEQGSNTHTHAYRTNRLYFETDYYPLKDFEPGQTILTLDQTIPFTWKGESGQGYMLHGIWMDSDINKFFSKLILPEGKMNHPYYPFTCKQHCISMNAWGIENPDLLARMTELVRPRLDDILEDLQNAAFSELLPLYREIKSTVPAELGSRWNALTVKPYLNEREQKEYTVEF